MNLYDANDAYKLRVEMPGVAGKDVEVTPGPVDGTILVKATGSTENAPGAAVFTESVSPDGRLRFERTIPVSWDADAEKVKTEMSNGILKITVRKKDARTKKGAKGRSAGT